MYDSPRDTVPQLEKFLGVLGEPPRASSKRSWPSCKPTSTRCASRRRKARATLARARKPGRLTSDHTQPSPTIDTMPDNLEDLFAHNRAWSAQIERDRPGFFTSLVKQQTPKYMWIGCSDSRVPANQITGLEPGEVFVHRNVANIVVHSDLNALSAIQFAVERLKVEHIMVVGPLRLRGRPGRAGRRAHRPGRQLDPPHPGRARPPPRAARSAARGVARQCAVRAQRGRAGGQRGASAPSWSTPGAAARRCASTAGPSACTTACSTTWD